MAAVAPPDYAHFRVYHKNVHINQQHKSIRRMYGHDAGYTCHAAWRHSARPILAPPEMLMPDLPVPPPPKRPRSRRLRKKLHIGEFRMLGFDYELTWRVAPSIDVQDRFIDPLLEHFIEPQVLSLRGGVNCGFVAARHGSVTDEDRVAFESWLGRWPDLAEVKVGLLRDAWYDETP